MTTRRNRTVRAVLAVPMAAALLLGTAACAEEGAGVTDDEFSTLENDFAELEERVGVLEEEAGI